jgi:hypothetical protein
LFRIVGESKGVVVSVTAVPDDEDEAVVITSSYGAQKDANDSSSYTAGGGWLPEPHQLASALRGQSGWGEDM